MGTQSAFVALNIEPDDDSDDEIDDTKEIQIEEALKLYQIALKLHSQGPEYYPQAAQAYLALFTSEIFKYPESLSEPKRLELYGESSDAEDYEHEDVARHPTVPTVTADGTPSTLPQILYLSYKNHGQFMLDYLKDQLNHADLGNGEKADGVHLPKQVIIDTVAATSRLFSEALERDDTDLELWRRTSRLCGLLGSRRIARFCLEAVLDVEGEGIDDVMEFSGLEEAFASQELKELLVALYDQISQSQPPISLLERQSLSFSIKKHMDLYPFLPSLQLSALDSDLLLPNSQAVPLARRVLDSPARTWTAVGKVILQQLLAEKQGIANPGPSVAIILRLPGDQATNEGYVPRDRGGGAVEPQLRDQLRACSTNLQATLDGGCAGNGVAPVGGKAGNGVDEAVSCGNEPLMLDAAFRATKPVVDGERSSNGAIINDEGGSLDDEPSNASELIPQSAEGDCGGQMKTSPGPNTITLPTRKRSSDSAGHHEPADGGRIRSKRIRARESVADAGVVDETTGIGLTKHISDQLEAITRADHWMFEVVGGLLSKLGVQSLGSLEELRNLVKEAEGEDVSSTPDPREVRRSRRTVIQDLRHILSSWTDEKGNVVLHSEDIEDPSSNIGGARNSGLTIFLEHSKRGGQKVTTRPPLSTDDGLAVFRDTINDSRLYTNEAAFQWIKNLLLPVVPGSGPTRTEVPSANRQSQGSTYTEFLWPDALKETVVQILVGQDGYIFKAIEEETFSLEDRILRGPEMGHTYQYSFDDHSLTEMVQTVFELHLDIYASITNPSSEVDIGTRTLQKDRLARWAGLASDLLNMRSTEEEGSLAQDVLTFRYLWAATFFSNMSDGVSREHVLLCLNDLKKLLEATGSPVVELQNNAVMPEVSVAATEREISRLTTMDLFLSIFSTENSNPVAVIESLEPILDPITNLENGKQAAQQVKDGCPGTCRDTVQSENKRPPSSSTSESVSCSQSTQKTEMARFLERGSASLRLFLWRRLRDAYEVIGYPPKVFSCCLRCIEIIMKDVKTAPYLNSAREHRQSTLLKWIRCLDDLIVKALTLALNEPSSFDCIDNEHLQGSMCAIAELSGLLHSFTMYEDSIRVGEIRPSVSSAHPSMVVFANKLREMQVRTWTLQYTLLKDGISQNQDIFITATDDLADYLRVVHYGLGIRSYCKLSNKVFLRFMKMELLRLTPAGTWESDLAQVMFDLHGLRFSPNLADLQDHGCPTEPLDRRTAIQIMSFVMTQVNRINIKDLPKTEFKSIVEKMQQVIGAPTQTNALMLNRRIFNAFIKSPVNPIDLYRCLRGVGDLSAVPVVAESAVVADKGWYFLLGHIALTRFRSQKRVTLGPTDDLDFASYFFRQDLEYGMDKWETWYRLATVYDAKIEEDVLWSAEKLNSQKTELTDLQRSAIHCYTMAVTTAIRCADTSFDNASKISDLYTDFGLRIYASSREPFSMEAFNLDDFEKHFSAQTQGMYKKRPFRDLELFPAWKFASVLFRKAMVEKPRRWTNHYMLAKCLWKLYSCEDLDYRNDIPADFREIIDACVQAIQALPERKDNKQEPILEPHYKLVSIVYKLVERKKLQPLEGSDILQATPYARKIPPSEEIDTWESYILQVLKALRTADKANWHHRMVARAAHVIYDDSASDFTAAMGAKHELTQQIFTKTMTLQVWKPEHERAGRHFVYTGRYVSFLVHLLLQLNDRASLEALTKRVRRRSGDFVGYAKVWQEVCLAHLKLLRRLGQIPEGHEDTIFKSVSNEDFQTHAGRLESWCHLPDTYSPIIDILRDVIELKKLNNGLMKSTLIDDLIADTYAMLYGTVVPELNAKASGKESRERMRVDHLLMNMDDPADIPPPSATMTPDPAAVKHRAKGVGRRELQRKAEAAILKPSAASEISKPPSTVEASHPDQSSREMLFVKEELAREDAQGLGSSVPASVHDSADDESELSEIDEEPVPVVEPVKPMFPNLVNSAACAGSAMKTDERINGDSPPSALQDAEKDDQRAAGGV
ncbi:MAG: Histone transcription regulator 3 [Pleopsidium flavum]|nr:MAG: Histone transcription regulator 3 [Pleopsidium flavum]